MHLQITLFLTLSFSVLLMKGQTSNALNPIHYTYTSEDGLNSNFVTSLFNDSRGLLWVGTQNGMNTFDGKQFKSIDFSNVSESFVAKTTQAPDGVIWFSTIDGLLYQIRNYTAIPHPLNDTINKIKNRNCVSVNLTIDTNGTIYSSGTSVILKIGYKKVAVVDRNYTIKKVKDTTKFQLYNGTLMGISNMSSIANYPNKVSKVIGFKADTLTLNYDGVSCRSCFQYCANTRQSFAISKGKKIMVYMNEQLKEVFLDAYSSNSIYFENDTTLWVGTQGKGLFKIVNHKVVQRLLPNERVHSFIKDFESGYWAGSEKGLIYYPNLTTTPFIVKDNNELFLSISQYNNELVGIIKPNTLFRGKCSRKLGPLHHYEYTFLAPGTKSEHSHITKRHTSNSSYKTDLINWKEITSTPTVTKARFLYTHQLDSFLYNHNRLYHLSQGNLNRITHQNEDIKEVKQIIPNNTPNQYFVTHRDGILLFKLNAKKNSFEPIKYYPSKYQLKNKFHLANYTLVTSDDDFLHLLNHELSCLEKVQSIPREDIRTVYQLDSFQTLLGTAQGLKLISLQVANDIHSIQIRNITNELGHAPQQVNEIEVLNDTIYALLESGVIICYPIDVLNSYPLTKGKMSIIKILANGHEVNKSTKIYSDQTILFNISTVSFKDRDQYLPQFRLLPLREEGEPLYSNQLSFYNLPANEYTLQVQDQYGQLVSYSFIVHDYYYQEWWFILMISFMIAALVFIPIHTKNKYKIAEARLEAEKDNWRLKTLTSQLKPHFIFNSLSSIQAFMLKHDPRSSNEFLTKFSMHIRHALEQSQADHFSLKKALVAIKNYLELEQMRLGGSFSFEINTHGIKTEQFYIPVMLLQPYIENAVIHGMTSINYPGMIRLDIEKISLNEIHIHISDNGIGLKGSNHKGNGLGTSINNERIKLINAQSQNQYEVRIYNNRKGKGVCVFIKIQFDNE